MDKKKNILKNLRKRNEQSRNNKQKLNEMNNSANIRNNGNGKPDIILNQSEDDIDDRGNRNNINENSGIFLIFSISVSILFLSVLYLSEIKSWK